MPTKLPVPGSIDRRSPARSDHVEAHDEHDVRGVAVMPTERVEANALTAGDGRIPSEKQAIWRWGGLIRCESREGSELRYDAFLSYSHSADGALAPAVRKGLQDLGKRWARRRAVRVFHDKSGLGMTERLWPSIRDALDESRCFVLLASPAAARSTWVEREIAYWRETKPDAPLLLALTEGELDWDDDAASFDSELSTALPPALADAYKEEPGWVDLRPFEHRDDLNIRTSADFRRTIADIAAPIHGVDRDEIEGEDLRQYRVARRLRFAAVAGLATLAVVATIAAVVANQQAGEAERRGQQAEEQSRTVMSARLAASAPGVMAERLDRGLLLAVQSARFAPTLDAEVALFSAFKDVVMVDLTLAGLDPSAAVFLGRDDGRIAVDSGQGVDILDHRGGITTTPFEVADADRIGDFFFSRGGLLMAVVFSDGTFQVLEVGNGTTWGTRTAAATGFDPASIREWMWGAEVLSTREFDEQVAPFQIGAGAFDRSGTRICLGDGGGSVHIFDVGRNQIRRLASVPFTDGLVTDVNWLSDGRVVANAIDLRPPYIVDWERGTAVELHDIDGFEPGIGQLGLWSAPQSASWDVATDHVLVPGKTDAGGNAVGWWPIDVGDQPSEGSPEWFGVPGTTELSAVEMTDDGRYVIAGDHGGLVYILSNDSIFPEDILDLGLARGPLPFHQHQVVAVDTGPESDRALSLAADGSLVVMELQPEIEVAALEATDDSELGPSARDLALSPDGRTLAVGTNSGSVSLWDTDEWRHFGEVQLLGEGEGLVRVDYGGEGSLVASVSDYEAVEHLFVVDPQALDAVGTYEGRQLGGLVRTGSQAVAVFYDDSQPCAEAPCPVLLVDPESGLELRDVTMNSSLVGTSLDGSSLFVQSGWDLGVVDADTGSTTTVEIVGSFGVTGIAEAREGSVLIVASADGTIEVFNSVAGSYQPRGVPLQAHDDFIYDIAVDELHGRFASLARGGFALWSLEDLRLLGFVANDSKSRKYTDAEFTPDGQSLVLARADGVIEAWPMDTSDWAAELCDVAGRDLTVEEWDEYVGIGFPYEPTCSRAVG